LRKDLRVCIHLLISCEQDKARELSNNAKMETAFL
jgi:hypothetical protein